MDERRTAEGVEHLQAAARELLGAARAFLDVVEEVVEDSDRLSGAAATISDLVRNFTGRGPQPWEQAAWTTDDDRGPSDTAWWDEPYENDNEDEDVAAGPSTTPPTGDAGQAGEAEEPRAEETPSERAPAKNASAKKAAAKKAPAKKTPAKKAAAKRSPSKKAPSATAPANTANAGDASEDAAPAEGGSDSTASTRPTSRVRRISVE